MSYQRTLLALPNIQTNTDEKNYELKDTLPRENESV